MPATFWAVGQSRRDHQLAAATDLHARDAVLPPLDQAAQRELDRLIAVPGTVELLAGVVLHADVVHLDVAAGHGLSTLTHHQIGDDQLARGRAVREFDLGFLTHTLTLLAVVHTGYVPKDQDILSDIHELVAEEKDLRAKLQHHEIDETEEHRRLKALEVQLDQCWDMLRQRRALRETGGDPQDAQVRPADEVEGYIG